MIATTVLVSLPTRKGASRAAGTTCRKLVVSFAASRRATDTAWGLAAGAAWAPLAAPVIRDVVRTVATSICRVRCIEAEVLCCSTNPSRSYLLYVTKAQAVFTPCDEQNRFFSNIGTSQSTQSAESHCDCICLWQ